MAESDDQKQQPAATLRNRRTTVEDAESDSDIATTTATSVSSTTKPSSAAASKKDTEEEDKKKKLTAAQVHKRVAQQQGTKKSSQLRNLVISLIVACIGVLLKSAFEKFVFTGREIAIEQTVGLQGNCFKTAYIPGPADIEISDHDQLAFVSSDDYSWRKESRFFHRPSSKTAKNGGIYTLALNHKNGSPKELELKSFTSDDFHPAGMSLYHFQDEKTHERTTRLFVINHSHKGDVVEIFDYSSEANTLTLVKTVNSDLFVTPRDIVAVDQDRFYLTNHHAMGNKYGRVAEDVTGTAMGSVIYYNGEKSLKVLQSLNNPYGIAGSPDGKQIYVSSFMDRLVHVYNTTADIAQGQLEHDVDIWVGNHVDHLSVDKHTGDIYVASHPSYSTYLRHKLGYEPQSPSHVVKIEKLAPENFIPQESSMGNYYFFPKPELPSLKWEVKDLFYSNGEDISASTVAAYWNNDLILGSSSSHHLLRCSLRLNQ
ncbi:Serum paraoxonase/arylesterase 2 [Mortierella hygrophila]|uniref:Serum paraoxonase/arylesterase 2 n=1 Tax=Mortierella hygrophila TaxID=979708 RepID=A0A9P6F1H4_9FUNG|nr:Serum paraoxonase/arylesterase 2 [Mortierella hygrophila]